MYSIYSTHNGLLQLFGKEFVKSVVGANILWLPDDEEGLGFD